MFSTHKILFYGCFIWYGRYIDLLLGSDGASIPDCITYFNNNSLGLRFTDMSSISYLDLTLSWDLDTGRVNLVTFRKESSGNVILRENSCHPSHTIRAIPVGELTRAKRNCYLSHDFSHEAETVCDHLRHRGYPDWMLKLAEHRVANTSRQTLLKQRISRSNIDNNQDNNLFNHLQCSVLVNFQNH